MCIHLNAEGKYQLYIGVYSNDSKGRETLWVNGYNTTVKANLSDKKLTKKALALLTATGLYNELNKDNVATRVSRYHNNELVNA